MELKHRVQASYLAVVMIWSTTPLAIQWSATRVDYLFGVTSRMVIGLVISLVLLRVMGLSLHRERRAVLTYLAAGLGIYGAMICVYWGAQYIPSGWISVFWGSLHFSPTAWLGVAALMVSVTLHSVSTVWTKAIGWQGHGLEITAGALLIAVPLYLMSWVLSGEHWPDAVPVEAALSIVYLGSIATVLGFGAFYYVLRHVDATRVALLTLMTPIIALWLGQWLNDEELTWTVIAGTGLILSGLALYEFGERKNRHAAA